MSQFLALAALRLRHRVATRPILPHPTPSQPSSPKNPSNGSSLSTSLFLATRPICIPHPTPSQPSSPRNTSNGSSLSTSLFLATKPHFPACISLTTPCLGRNVFSPLQPPVKPYYLPCMLYSTRNEQNENRYEGWEELLKKFRRELRMSFSYLLHFIRVLLDATKGVGVYFAVGLSEKGMTFLRFLSHALCITGVVEIYVKVLVVREWKKGEEEERRKIGVLDHVSWEYLLQKVRNMYGGGLDSSEIHVALDQALRKYWEEVKEESTVVDEIVNKIWEKFKKEEEERKKKKRWFRIF